MRDGEGGPVFSIVIPTCNRPQILRETLAAITAFETDIPYEVIVVDDAPQPQTEAVIAEAAAGPVTVRSIAQNRDGAACARNAGARMAAGRWVVFCDDDMVLAPDHLQRRLAAHERYGPRALIAGAWEFSPAVTEELRSTPFGRFRLELEAGFQHDARGDELDPGRFRMPLVGAATLSIARDLFWELGGFDASFPVAGAEDQDLSIRAQEAGCTLVLDTSIRCLHNDNWVDLSSYCARERRSASTMPFLLRRHPARVGQTPYILENRPIAYGDSPRRVAKKLVKSLLTRPAVLPRLLAAAELLERTGVPEGVLRRAYRTLLGLYLFDGFRLTWGKAQAQVEPEVQVGVGGTSAPDAAPGDAASGRAAVTVTIVLHNSAEHLTACLHALTPDLDAGRATLVVVDNASPDAADGAIVAAQAPTATVVRSETNRGFAGGCNLAWARVETPFWLLLNPDVMLEPGALAALVALMESRPDIGICAPWLRPAAAAAPEYPGRAMPSLLRTTCELTRAHLLLPRRWRAALLQGPYVRSAGDLDGISETGWVPGAAMLIRSTAIAQTGPLDTSFFMYGEDVDLCWRMHEAGWTVAACAEAVATHLEGSSSARTWTAPEVQRRIATGVMAACRIHRGRRYADAFGRLTWLTLAAEAARRGSADGVSTASVRDAWSAALRER